MPLADESTLIAALCSRDAAACEQLLRDHGGQLLGAAIRIMGNEEDARDAVQNGLVSALKNIARFDGKSRLSTWLHRIVINACLMRLRSRRRRPEVLIDDLLPRFDSSGHREAPGPAWNPDPAAGIERERLVRACRDAIAQLPDGYREVLVLRDIESLDTDATAAALGLTPEIGRASCRERV